MGPRGWSRFVSMALLMGASSIFSELGRAQEAQDASDQEIVVVAPRLITTETKEKGSNGRDTAIISLKMVVQYGDLDLRRSENVGLLMARIRSVSRDACKYLDRLYPLLPDPHCKERAFVDALPQAENAIALAMRTDIP